MTILPSAARPSNLPSQVTDFETGDAERIFDDFTFLAAQVCNTPISLVSIAVENRQLFHSIFGVPANKMPYETEFCGQALANPEDLLIVEDAALHDRFSSHPWVLREPHLRFYAGAPLVTRSGLALGTLCVIDHHPRSLTDAQQQALRALARQAVGQLDARRNMRLLKDAARQLDAQRRETQIILDHVPAYVFYKDTQNKILRVNRTVADSLSMEIASIEGRHTKELYPEEADKYYQDDLVVMKSGCPMLGILEPLQVEHGEQRWVSTDKIPIQDENGIVTGVLVVASDVTHLKRTEESLRDAQAELRKLNAELEQKYAKTAEELAESEIRYEDLYHNAPDMFASINPDTGCILECNDTLLRKLGYERDEIIGQHVTKLYHPDCRINAKELFEEFRRTGGFSNREMTFARKDGSRIEISLSSSAVRDRDGRIVASRGVCRDITEKKRMEEESQQRLNQLAHMARVAMMNEMATGIAHELNQPLYAIKNYALGLKLRLDTGHTDLDSMRPVVKDIADETDRLATRIQSIRRYMTPCARLSASVEPLVLVQRAVDLLTEQLKRHEVTASVVGIEGLPTIECDEVQIEQVLINLILNAAEAMSTVASQPREVVVAVEQLDGGRLRFSVSDKGPGLMNVDEEEIFNAFCTTKEDGMGMGLAICRTIVEAHGGHIEVVPNTGPGLTMSFLINGEAAGE